MKKIMLIIGILGITFISNAQDHHNKKYSLGQNSVNKWYKLFTIDLNGNGNYNSVNITVNFNYVNTWNKYNSTAIIRLREGPDASHSDWQNSVLGINQSVLKLKKTNTKIYELWGYSQSGWGHLSFEASITKESNLIINIPDNPIVISNIDSYEDVPYKGDWYFTSGNLSTNNRIGIGTTNPTAMLEIKQKEDPSADKGLIISEPNNSQKIYLHLADNTSGEYGYFNLGGDTKLRGNGLHSSFDGALGIGTTNPGSWKLAVNGKIRAKEIKVEAGWSDFVFENDYNLPTLKEVEKHIEEKGHLKDIPSAKEVKENGIFLGEMDSKLLQKIEELTLYTIQQEKEIERLKSIEKRLAEVEKFLKSKK